MKPIKAKKVLKEKGITQQMVADETKQHITDVNAILNGKQQCKVKDAIKIAELAGLTVEEAFEPVDDLKLVNSVETMRTPFLSPETLAPGI